MIIEIANQDKIRLRSSEDIYAIKSEKKNRSRKGAENEK